MVQRPPSSSERVQSSNSKDSKDPRRIEARVDTACDSRRSGGSRGGMSVKSVDSFVYEDRDEVDSSAVSSRDMKRAPRSSAANRQDGVQRNASDYSSNVDSEEDLDPGFNQP